jgi:light-regulated signal transduction histidine kinase (bacteriophytochrome)
MGPEANDLLNHIVTNAQRMERLLDDLLRLASLERQPLSNEPVYVKGLVTEVLAELQLEHSDRSIRGEGGDLPDCTGDPSLLRQVFVNLLSNAFKFTLKEQKAVIEVGCKEQDGERVYFARDNGTGFEMKYAADRLFGVFQRFHSDEFEGTGIGLSIVQRIITRHGGRIWADAAVNNGATFYFTLPYPAESQLVYT